MKKMVLGFWYPYRNIFNLVDEIDVKPFTSWTKSAQYSEEGLEVNCTSQLFFFFQFHEVCTICFLWLCHIWIDLFFRLNIPYTKMHYNCQLHLEPYLTLRYKSLKDPY